MKRVLNIASLNQYLKDYDIQNIVIDGVPKNSLVLDNKEIWFPGYKSVFRFELLEETGTYKVSLNGLVDPPEDLIIPSEYNNIPVTHIGVCDNYLIKTITIPNSVTHICDDAFNGCTSLKEISIGNSVKYIGVRAFRNCRLLQNILLPNSLREIGMLAFMGCGFNYVIIPDQVKTIGQMVFYTCSKLTKIVIGTDTTFEASPFDGISHPIQICYKDNVGEWDDSIYLPEGSTVHYYSLEPVEYNCWYWLNGVPEIWPKYTWCFSFTKNLDGNYDVEVKNSDNFIDKIEIPNEIIIPSHYKYVPVTGIRELAFRGCSNVTKIVLPDSVTAIRSSAFEGCSSLVDVNIPNGVTYIGYNAFKNCSSLVDITIPDCVTDLKFGAFNGCTSLVTVYISKSVTVIENTTFKGCSSLVGVVIPVGVTAIEFSAFEGCSNLVDIVIPDTVTYIGTSTFEGCSSITIINIPTSVNYIGSSAFCDCSNINDVTIPNGVTSIESSTFSGCSNMDRISLPESLTHIGSHAFAFCSKLMAITIPYNAKDSSGVTDIDDFAFSECKLLGYLTLPNSVSHIGNGVFSGCVGIKIFLSEDHPFYYIDSGCLLERDGNRLIFAGRVMYIPKQTNIIGSCSISGSFAAPIKIPLSVQVIESHAFFDCEGTTVCVPYKQDELPIGWSPDWHDGTINIVWEYTEEDTTTYLVTENGDYLTDEQSNLLII